MGRAETISSCQWAVLLPYRTPCSPPHHQLAKEGRPCLTTGLTLYLDSASEALTLLFPWAFSKAVWPRLWEESVVVTRIWYGLTKVRLSQVNFIISWSHFFFLAGRWGRSNKLGISGLHQSVREGHSWAPWEHGREMLDDTIGQVCRLNGQTKGCWCSWVKSAGLKFLVVSLGLWLTPSLSTFYLWLR